MKDKITFQNTHQKPFMYDLELNYFHVNHFFKLINNLNISRHRKYNGLYDYYKQN